MKIVLTIYNHLAWGMGTAVIILFFISIVVSIYKHFKMKSVIKEYAEKLHKSNFLYDSFGNMTEEEKKKMEENKYAKSKVTLDFKDMSVKKETK